MKTQYPPNADTDNSLYSSDAFRMFCFKVLPCSKRFCHDWVTCPFAHPAEKAKRRDPRAYTYTGVACPDQKKNATCPRGDACTFAHNVFEYHLHPSRYRTQLCNDGANCARKICFFAHSMEELRVSSVKVVPPDSAAANKLSSPGTSSDFDAVDPFGGQGDDTVSALKQRSSTSPVSPLYADAWDTPSTHTPGSHEPPSRRSSLQLQQKQQQQQRQHRMSMDQIGMRPQRLVQQQTRHSVDLASELQLQQLQLSAMKAQLQLQQSALHSLGATQPDASVAQLAQALAQLQMASSLASAEQMVPAALQQQPLVPNLTQVLMQQMILQQQAQAQVQAQHVQAQVQGQLLQQLQGQAMAGQAGQGMADLGVGMLVPGQQAALTSGYSLPLPGAGVGLPDYGNLSKMPSLPGPDLSSMQAFSAGSPPLLSPSPVSAFDGMFGGSSVFSAHGPVPVAVDGDESGHR